MTHRNLCCGIAAVASLLVAATSANAASVAFARVELDTIETTGTAAINIDSTFYVAAAIANDTAPGVEQDVYFGMSAGSVSAGSMDLPQAQGEFGEFFGQSAADAGAVGNALATTLGEYNFSLSGSGEVTLNFDIILAAEADIGFAEAGVTIADSFGAFEVFSIISEAPGCGELDSCAFALTYSVDGLATGFFSLESAARVDTAVIPVPAAGWLLAGGLLSLLRLRRRA